jgi:hypothetical protein
MRLGPAGEKEIRSQSLETFQSRLFKAFTWNGLGNLLKSKAIRKEAVYVLLVSS